METPPIVPVDYSQVLQNPVEQPPPAVDKERQTSPATRSGATAEAPQVMPVDGSQSVHVSPSLPPAWG